MQSDRHQGFPNTIQGARKYGRGRSLPLDCYSSQILSIRTPWAPPSSAAGIPGPKGKADGGQQCEDWSVGLHGMAGVWVWFLALGPRYAPPWGLPKGKLRGEALHFKNWGFTDCLMSAPIFKPS